jgi:hypothetical protein
MDLERREYQDEAFDLALEELQHGSGGYALFMEQRTGKTPVACRIAHRLNPQRILIIGPEISQQVWESHIDQFNLIRAGRFYTNQIVPKNKLDNILFVPSTMTLFKARKKLRRWVSRADTLVIVDEGHDFKDPHSKRSRALRIIGRVAKWRLLLTGTPQESGLEDYWAQFDFVDDGLFGDWGDFQARYLLYGGFKGKKILGYRNEDEFREKMQSRSYRVLLEEVKETPTDIAPPHVVTFDLVESKKAYEQMKQQFIVWLNETIMRKKLRADGTHYFEKEYKHVAAPLIITQTIKLQQLAGGAVIDDEQRVHWFGHEKLEQAGALMLALGKVPQVWFVRYVHELYKLGALFKYLGREVTYISGAHKGYVSGTPFDIAIVQIASGKSIDLAHAEEAIFYSWGYSYLQFDQAKFRIRSFHGIRARYHFLVARGTVDEDLYSVVSHKTSFAHHIIDKYRTKLTPGG